MKTALQRQLVTTGWHLLGGAIALLMLFVGAGIWGHGIEARIDKGEEAHVSDHRAIGRINHALHQAHIALPAKHEVPVSRGGDAIQQPSKGHQQHSPSSKGGGGGSGKGGVGGGEGPSAPGQGGSDGASAPQGPGSSGEQARGNPAPPANEGAQSQQPNLPATVEATGKAAGEAVEGVGKAAEGAVCGTVEAPGCSK